MRWAITPRETGELVGYRALADDDTVLVDGENFISTTDPEGLVLAEDSSSLRRARPAELLARARARRWGAIKSIRQQQLDGGVEWNGHRWDTEEDDINRIARTISSWSRALALPPEQQAKLPGPIPLTIDWTTADDQETTLTFQELVTLDAVISLHVGNVFGIAKALRAAINAATTIQAIDEVNWP